MITMRINSAVSIDANSVDIPTNFARNVRVVFLLCKDENISSPNEIWRGANTGTSTLSTIYPSYVDNPGITYRIVYDKTYRVRGGQNTQVLVRIPGSVFYDNGVVKFKQNGS